MQRVLNPGFKQKSVILNRVLPLYLNIDKIVSPFDNKSAVCT